MCSIICYKEKPECDCLAEDQHMIHVNGEPVFLKCKICKRVKLIDPPMSPN